MRLRLLANLARSLHAGWTASRANSARRWRSVRPLASLPLEVETLEVRTLPSVLIAVPDHRDLVYDNTRDLLYITTSQGRLERWDPVQQQLLSAIVFGALQNGADITKDGGALYVADAQLLTAGFGTIHKLNINSVAVTELVYAVQVPERSAWDINVNDQGVGLVSSLLEISGHSPLRSLDTAGVFSIKNANLGSGPDGTVQSQTNIFRSPDRSLYVLLESNSSSGPVMTYASVGGTFLNQKSLGVNLNTSLAAINRDNSQIAVEVNSNVRVMDQSLNPLYELVGIDGGIIYDARQDLLYGASSATDEVIVFASATGSELYRLPVGHDVTPSAPYGNGEMEISSDSKWLFLATPDGVVMFGLTDPPTLSVDDVTVVEGNTGTKTVTFTVTLSAAATDVVTVDYATANGSAQAGSDYDAASQSLTFNIGDRSKTVSVTVRGDRTVEPHETFSLNLSNATHALIRDGQGTAVISNDDVGVTLTSTDSNPVLNSRITVNVQFTEAIDPNTFDASDITVTNGSVVSFTRISSTEYVIVILAGSDGPVTVSIGEDKVTSSSGYGNLASNVFSTVVDAVNDLPSITSIADQIATRNSVVGPLSFTIGDGETPANALTLTVSSSNTQIVPLANIVLGGSGANRTVTVTPAPDQWGTLTISLTVTDSRGDTATTSFAITFNPVPGTPTVTNAQTEFPRQSTSGLVISRNSGDGLEVTHFQITNITGGTLFQNDGVTVINADDFITYDQAHAGLKFTPVSDSAGAGTIQVQSSVSDATSGLGGGTATAVITVVGFPVRMYRAYNPIANFHFFTTSKTQFDNAVAHGYRDETTGRPGYSVHSAQVTNSVALYRVYNLQRGFHYYTADAQERRSLIDIVPPSHPQYGKIGWRDEGIEGYIYTTAQSYTTPIYRLYNREAGTHLFTESATTKNAILQQFPTYWREESLLGHAFLAPAVGTIPADPPAGSGSSSQPPAAPRGVRRATETSPLPPLIVSAESTSAPVRGAAEITAPVLGGLLATETPASASRRNLMPAATVNNSRDTKSPAIRQEFSTKPAVAAPSSPTWNSDWTQQTTQFFSAFDGRAWE
jgi:hypothetical protein